MSKAELVFYLACVVLLVVPICFIRHKVYKDGIGGRIALVLIVICAFAILGQAGTTYYDAWVEGRSFSSAGYHVEWEEALLVAGFALYASWNLYRFKRRLDKQLVGSAEETWPGTEPVSSIAVGFHASADVQASRKP